jgi:hypothetical protein
MEGSHSLSAAWFGNAECAAIVITKAGNKVMVQQLACM